MAIILSDDVERGGNAEANSEHASDDECAACDGKSYDVESGLGHIRSSLAALRLVMMRYCAIAKRRSIAFKQKNVLRRQLRYGNVWS